MARAAGLAYIRTLFNIGKKFVDILDDLWNTLRGILPAETIRVCTPFIMGSVGFITHLGEGIQGIKDAYQAYKNEKIGQRKTRIVTSVLTFMIAGGGVGLASSLVAAASGAAISGATLILAPVLIPALLTAIYSLALWRKAYIFYRAREEELKAKKTYEEEGPKEVNEAAKALKKKNYEECREERLRAERDFAFNIVEVLTSALVMTATILGTAALVGASAASLGAFPMVMLLVGVVGGVACKLLEYYDEKKNFSFSRRIRDWFTGKSETLTPDASLKPKNSPVAAVSQVLGKDEQKAPGSEGSAFLYKRLAEENVIELSALRKTQPLPPLNLSRGREEKAVVYGKRKRLEIENEVGVEGVFGVALPGEEESPKTKRPRFTL